MTSLFAFFLTAAFAFIPRGLLILDRVSENSGSGVYQIEQEVQFENGQGSLSLKETWLVESENSMRLTVTGLKELQDKVFFQVTYSGGNKISSQGTGRVTTDFIERYFHFRNGENLAQALVQLKIVPQGIFAKRPLRSIKDAEYKPEPFVHLARTGGVVSYGFGALSPEQGDPAPGLWVQQDQFVISKIRLPTLAEVSANRYSVYSRGLQFPKSRTVAWGKNLVQMQTLSVVGKAKDAMKSPTKGTETRVGLTGQPAESLIQEFYSRFR